MAASATTPEPEAPANDLLADRESVIQKIKTELGPGTRPRVVAGQFVLAGPPGSGTAEASAPFVERVLEALFNNRFRARPAHTIAVYLFPDAASYDRYCRAAFQAPCISVYGFFSPSQRSLVMNVGLGIGTLSHELVHPILDADFPQAPTWINEGIASLYEAPVLPRRGEIHGRKNWRYPRLQSALRSSRDAPAASLASLFSLSDEAFRGKGEDLHYAMARYACQWLDQRDQLWAFYHLWRDRHQDDPSGEKSFAAVLGRSPGEANADWVRWVLSLDSGG